MSGSAKARLKEIIDAYIERDGSAGVDTAYGGTSGAGGSGGYAVSGNGNITWSATGTRLGAIS